MLKRRRLPHLDLPGREVFVTFRLYGSLPRNRTFPSKNLTSGQAFVAMDRILDTARCGPTFLRQPAIAELVLDSLRRGVRLGHYDLHAWAIMSSHVHLLITPHVSLSKLLRSLKAATSKRANFLLHRTGEPAWQDESCDHLVRDGEEFRRIQSIENNPVSAGLVASPEDYRRSSAGRPERPRQAGAWPNAVHLDSLGSANT
jgi:REP element-mobilizing transposase RayT